MSKIKLSGQEHYEILFIVPNKYTEEEAEKIYKKVKDIIVNKEGNITFSEVWGKKRLAYKIEDYNHGYYYLLEFDLDGINLAKIDRSLRMSNEILRHQIVVKYIKTAEQIAKEKKISAKIAAKNVAKEEDAKIEQEAKEQAEDKSKVDLKDLDKN